MNNQQQLTYTFLKQLKTSDEFNSFLAQLQRGIEMILEGEPDDHLGYDKHEKPHLPIKFLKNNWEAILFQIKKSRIKTPIKPKIDITVSITVHDKKVCLSVSLKNSLNIQKPESLM
jgi:hypothetical protein